MSKLEFNETFKEYLLEVKSPENRNQKELHVSDIFRMLSQKPEGIKIYVTKAIMGDIDLWNLKRAHNAVLEPTLTQAKYEHGYVAFFKVSKRDRTVLRSKVTPNNIHAFLDYQDAKEFFEKEMARIRTLTDIRILDMNTQYSDVMRKLG